MKSGESLEDINNKHPYRCIISGYEKIKVSYKCTHRGFVGLYETVPQCLILKIL